MYAYAYVYAHAYVYVWMYAYTERVTSQIDYCTSHTNSVHTYCKYIHQYIHLHISVHTYIEWNSIEFNVLVFKNKYLSLTCPLSSFNYFLWYLHSYSMNITFTNKDISTYIHTYIHSTSYCTLYHNKYYMIICIISYVQ